MGLTMGSGRDGCCSVRPDVWKLGEFWGAIFLMICSLIWLACCLGGLNKVPKCRYGDNDCYFVRPVEAINKDGSTSQGQQFFNRAVEGDNDNSLEQLAIPLLSTLLCVLPSIFVFIGVLLGHTPKTMEIGKFFMTGCTVLMILSIRIFEQMTFECRWWNNTNQEDSEPKAQVGDDDDHEAGAPAKA